MQTDDERQIGRFGRTDVEVLGPAATDDGRDQDAVAQAADRKELADALYQADDGCFEPAQLTGHAYIPSPR